MLVTSGAGGASVTKNCTVPVPVFGELLVAVGVAEVPGVVLTVPVGELILVGVLAPGVLGVAEQLALAIPKVIAMVNTRMKLINLFTIFSRFSNLFFTTRYYNEV